MAQPRRQPLGASGANASGWSQAAFGSPAKLLPTRGEGFEARPPPEAGSEQKSLARDALAVIRALEAEVGQAQGMARC